MSYYNDDERKAFKEQQMARQEHLLKDLAENWQASPKDMVEYLQFSAKFHNYSACNTALIYAQNRAAIFCGSYTAFQKMGYAIKRGEHGMVIRTYTPQRFYAEYPGAGWKPLSGAGYETRRRVEMGLYMSREEPHFGYGKVWDIAQTTCPPEDYPKLLGVGYDSKPHADLYKALCVYCEKNGIITAEKNMHGAALRGTHNPTEQKITTNSLLRDTQKVSTLLHEMAHNFLGHEPGKTPTMQAEFEADALSIMLGAQFGIEPTEARLGHFVESYEHFSEQLIADGKDVSVNNLFHNVRLTYQNRIDKLLTVVDAQLGIEHTSQMQLIGADGALVEEPFEMEADAYVERPDLGDCYPPRLFVDMDGTLANFHAASNYLEKMWEPGYFEQLDPYSRAVETIDLYRATYPDSEIFVISATIDSPTCIAEKEAWLDQHLPHVDADHRIFVPMGEDKSQYIPDGIRRTDVLLDDYNKNLNEWKEAGGTSVKFVNEINDRGLHGEPFKGERIAYTAAADRSVYQLSRLISSIEPVPITAKQTQEVERTQEEKKETTGHQRKRFSVSFEEGIPPMEQTQFDTMEEVDEALQNHYLKCKEIGGYYDNLAVFITDNSLRQTPQPDITPPMAPEV